MLDYAVIVPRLQRVYEWSAEELDEPRLLELVAMATDLRVAVCGGTRREGWRLMSIDGFPAMPG